MRQDERSGEGGERDGARAKEIKGQKRLNACKTSNWEAQWEAEVEEKRQNRKFQLLSDVSVDLS